MGSAGLAIDDVPSTLDVPSSTTPEVILRTNWHLGPSEIPKKATKSGLQGLIWLWHYRKDGDHLVNLRVPSLETQSFHDGTLGQAASIGFQWDLEKFRGVALFPLQFQFLVDRWIENSP